MAESRRRWWRGLLLVVGTVALASLTYLLLSVTRPVNYRPGQHSIHTRNHEPPVTINSSLPALLMKQVYNESDFVNEVGIVPSFWEKQKDTKIITWGPCFPPKTRVDWNKTIARWYHANDTKYHPMSKAVAKSATHLDLSDYCRPGFIIIGAGKCGTSSLYHYLVGHPRVLPASQKQIHYFKYYTALPIQWYLSHFPTAKSFLSAGALMTGEASPGYMPYPDVAARTAKKMSGAKIIALGRNPIERAYSSYRYSYLHPALDMMKRGAVHNILKNQTDDYYQQYLFGFQEMMQAELKVLRGCLAPGGPGEEGAKSSWGKKPWAIDEYKRREEHGLPPLVDLDANCYGGRISKLIPRRQFKDLVEASPEKVINVPNMFLVQALLGRSLYVLPLEWWYNSFSRDDLYFVCTEEMKDMTGEPLNDVGQFLGLPSFNFSGIVGEGMFNVGGHRGYDEEVSWDQVQEQEHAAADSKSNNGTDIPLSDDFRQELLDFIRPYNERLFELVGRRCNWD